MSVQVSMSHSLPAKFMVKDGYKMVVEKPISSTSLRHQEEKCMKNRRNRKCKH